jgi:hypothetical protein
MEKVRETLVWRIGRRKLKVYNEVLGDKLVPPPICSPQISPGLNSVRTSQETHSSVIKTIQLMQYGEIIAVCSGKRTKHITVFCGQNVEFINAKFGSTYSNHCWRRMEKISWTDHVRNEKVLLRVKEQRNILHETSKRTANWIGHILRRNCLLRQVTEGKIKGGIEVTGRRGRRCRKLLDDFKERRGYSHPKEEALDRTM